MILRIFLVLRGVKARLIHGCLKLVLKYPSFIKIGGRMLELSDYDFDLPETSIARYPAKERSQSRLLAIDRFKGQWQDQTFLALGSYLRAGDLLVLNNSKVMPARLYGQKETGGRVELLIERILSSQEVLSQIRASKPLKAGQNIILDSGERLYVIERKDNLFQLRFLGQNSALEVMQASGHIPLPPYLHRAAEALDSERYQTVYAKPQGSVAAPTAGLHFDEAMLAHLQEQGIELAYLTLHVGAGTFQPVRVNKIEEHQLHAEWLEVPESVCTAVRQTKARGGRVIAVGTTTVRALESAARTGSLEAFSGDSNIFIYPGYSFRVIDGLLTNFHLPQSSLLMLVAAFAGYETTLNAYHHAIASEYRFYSYGDCMLIL